MKLICTGDLESDGLLPEATRVWCGVFKDCESGAVHRFGPDDIDAMLSFMDTVTELRMHGGLFFDWPLLRKLYGYDYTGKKVDTLLQSRLQRPDRRVPLSCPNRRTGPHSVEAWGWRLGHHKVEHDDWSQYSQEMLHRCEQDVEIQCLIYDALQKEGREEGWGFASQLTTRLFELLQYQEESGWTVDTDHLERACSLLTHWIRKIDLAISPGLPHKCIPKQQKQDGVYNWVSKPFLKSGDPARIAVDWYGSDVGVVGGVFSRVAFRKVDLDKNEEVKALLLNEGWEPSAWNTNSEGEKTSPKLNKDDEWIGIRGTRGRLISRRIQCRQRLGVLRGWNDKVRPDGRISPVVNGLAATYRARHGVVVNVPRASGTFFGAWMRKCFVAKDGWVQVGTDAEGCQLRMLAHLMDDEGYTKAIVEGTSADGTDPHSITQRLVGLPTRDHAKVFNYAIIFGASDKRAGQVMGGSAADGKRGKDALFAGLPRLKEVIATLTEEWRSHAQYYFNKQWGRKEFRDGWITGLDGRRVYIDSEHKILVDCLQSMEAILMTLAYVMFHKWMDDAGYKRGTDYNTLIWYHDEYQVECRPELAKEVARLSELSISWASDYFKLKCPHVGSATIGKNWAECH